MDIRIDHHGSIFLVHSLSNAGKEWIDENINTSEETQYFMGALVVEHRYIRDIAEGMVRDGLEVE